MKILILVAMDKELNLLLGAMSEYQQDEVDGMTVWRGHAGRHEVAVARCGIGKVNAAVNAWRLCRALEPELVVNSGVAGGADASLPVGTLLVASEATNHDVWCGPGTQWGAPDGFPVRFRSGSRILELATALRRDDVVEGLICSGDRFITSPEEVASIKSRFSDALAVDMESAPIMQVCSMLGIECNILRVVSDTPGSGDNLAQYHDFFERAPEKSFALISYFLENY